MKTTNQQIMLERNYVTNLMQTANIYTLLISFETNFQDNDANKKFTINGDFLKIYHIKT